MKKENSIKFYKNLKTKNISIVLILAKFQNKWIFCKHKNRDTYEICGGHIEKNEDLENAAKRELYEESGAICKELKLVGFLANYNLNPTQYSALFYADIQKLDKLPNFEMKEVCLFNDFPLNTTYPETYLKIQKIIKD